MDRTRFARTTKLAPAGYVLAGTKISGGPVQGPVFDFAPVMNQFLQAHLFGDIFARDNLDWQSRELVMAALAAMSGVEAQLRSNLRISMNVGLTESQLRSVSDILTEHGRQDAAARIRAGLRVD